MRSDAQTRLCCAFRSSPAPIPVQLRVRRFGRSQMHTGGYFFRVVSRRGHATRTDSNRAGFLRALQRALRELPFSRAGARMESPTPRVALNVGPLLLSVRQVGLVSQHVPRGDFQTSVYIARAKAGGSRN